ncbi:methyltransferase Fkbm family protein [Ferriphaselus amnicola]|uniref:Methyltransferase Fkbm family protein n=2 Tax=Ferriphaselus amnicola TaxID=1188319 RepID=A0A2Z6G8H1_9PROT|nr:methyltransferase Fkbm family protein [Ferriphaselus amnicola]
MRALLKRYLSPATRNRIRSMQPSFMFRRISFSQCGEDLLVVFLLDLICGARPKRYLDVGANHPYHLSNTALLSARGGTGIVVEPDPYFANLLRKARPKDRVLEEGVHFSGEARAEFFILDSPTLNTFSRHEMERYVSMGHRLEKTLSVRLRGINEILEMAGDLDFMNLDIEGLDKTILEQIDWDKYRPACICVETITYETRQEPRKLTDIVEFMQAHDYMLYADTFINSIFVDRRQWQARWERG